MGCTSFLYSGLLILSELVIFRNLLPGTTYGSFVCLFLYLRPTLMHTKNLYENGPNPFFFFGTKNMSEGHLMHTVLVCYFFDKLGQACLCG